MLNNIVKVLFGVAKVHDFATLARRVIMSVNAEGNEKKVVPDRFWLRVCLSMESDVFMPLEWIEQARHIKLYGARLVELNLTPEFNNASQFGIEHDYV